MQRTSFPHPNRRSPRLRGFDYAQRGAYFVTVCTAGRAPILGAIFNDAMVLNDAGRIAEYAWADLPNHFADVELDAFVIMPNHVHGVLILGDPRAGSGIAGTSALHGLSVVIGAFKSYSAKRINALRGTAGMPVWQQRFYDHIIRSERDLNAIRDYIINNPLKWALDVDNEANKAATSRASRPYDYAKDAGVDLNRAMKGQ